MMKRILLLLMTLILVSGCVDHMHGYRNYYGYETRSYYYTPSDNHYYHRRPYRHHGGSYVTGSYSGQSSGPVYGSSPGSYKTGSSSSQEVRTSKQVGGYSTTTESEAEYSASSN